MNYHKLQDARMSPRPTGDQIGWAYQESPARARRPKRMFTMDASPAKRDLLWRNGENGYEWIRALYYDKTDGYQIEVQQQ